jgi:hypothetical protein
MRPDEWKKLFELRDDLEGEDRTLLRKLIRHVETLEQEIKKLKALLIRKQSEDANNEHGE